jgi:RNA polymerase sigma factor (sigma-70 family)
MIDMEFERLYDRISPRLKKIASFYGRRGYSFDRDDLYQEMTGHLWNKFKDGVPEEVNDTYIIKGCEFHILNYMRKEKEKIYRVSLEEPLNESGDTLRESLAGETESPDKTVDKKMLIDYIMNNGFSKREKEVFRLLLEGYTVRETGEKIGISHVMVVKLKNKIVDSVTKLVN